MLAAALLDRCLRACARSDGPPEIVVDRTPCSHCGMLISEPLYAAAYQAPGADARVFDDIGCLRDAARREGRGALRIWFHDAADGRWIDGVEAVFVASPSIRTPMGGGMLAYRDPAAAGTRGRTAPRPRHPIDRRSAREGAGDCDVRHARFESERRWRPRRLVALSTQLPLWTDDDAGAAVSEGPAPRRVSAPA